MKKHKKVIKRKVKRKVKRKKRVLRKPKLRLELDIPTSTKFVTLNPLGFEFKSQVFIKDNKGRKLLNGPIDFDHAVAIISHYNENPKIALPRWLVGN